MFQKLFPCGARLLLAGAAVLWTAGPGQAQVHVGGVPGAHVGGYHPGFVGGYHTGGYHPGYSASQYHPAFSTYRSPSYPPYYVGAYPSTLLPYLYNPNPNPYAIDHTYFGFGPGSGDGYLPQSTTPSPGATPSPNYSPPRETGGGDEGVQPAATSSPGLAPQQADTTAHVTVDVPANAEVWFEGVKMHATGPVREYLSPALRPGRRYFYEIRASWAENGRQTTQSRQIIVSAGSHVHVDFPLPSGTAPSATKGR